MKLKKKITGLLTAVFVLFAVFAAIAAVPVSAAASETPQTTLLLEPRRTADGMDYDVYIEHTNTLSTLLFAVEFSTAEKGTLRLVDNACFDSAYSEWNTDTHASLKAYLGRTGQKAGFSSEDRIKVAQISLPFDAAAVGEVTATVSNALCAGVVQTASDAVKGCVNVPLQPIRYVLRECSILSFDPSKVNLLSAQNRRAVILYASCNAEGRLVSTHIQTIDLKQGENELSLDGIDFGPFETLSVMVWDSTSSLRPLTDKATIQYQK